MLRQLLAGQGTVRLGRLDPRRDLTYVGDTVDGFVRAAGAPGIDGETIQLGTGRSESIGDLFAVACRLLAVEATTVEDPARLRPAASEVMTLQSDPARARALLGWEATTSLEDGMRQTIEWLRGHPAAGDLARLQL
jgi:UDP-glucose 4-epimerase